MIAYQQTIFGGETPFRTDGMVPAIMFQNKITGRYLANGPDNVDMSDPNGDVTEKAAAFAVFDNSLLKHPSSFKAYRMIKLLSTYLDYREVMRQYTAVQVLVTFEEYGEIIENN